ncbi:COX assembly mitochondrial protein homolog isoform X1 [Dermacentor variabilis]|uniref:COX assembly mitochondrial protein homolog isoform X1 n=1 Tax=Dermacentor variabilis TaxID=34621 RepID=UPI003F5C1D21
MRFVGASWCINWRSCEVGGVSFRKFSCWCDHSLEKKSTACSRSLGATGCWLFSASPSDPSDRRLRKVEVEVLIPQKMRNKARDEKCADLVLKFGECSKREGLMLPFMCRKENDALKACLKKWYEDPDFQQICREEYLSERSNFRETGVWRKKDKRAEIRSKAEESSDA